LQFILVEAAKAVPNEHREVRKVEQLLEEAELP
jgi:hypothetical protein